MKKTAKIIIALVLMFAFTLCVFTACNKDKTETKEIDEKVVGIMFTGANGGDGVIAALGKLNNIKVDYKTNFDGVEATGYSVLTQDNGSEFGGTDTSIMHQVETIGDVETEQYVGYAFNIRKGEVKKSSDIYNLVQVIDNDNVEQQVNKIEASAYNAFCKDNLVYYVSSLGTTVFNMYGEIIDTVVYSGTCTYKNGNLESTTITATYEDVENEIQGKITLTLSADEKQITKATVEQNGKVVFEGTYTYGVDTIIMPSINGSTWSPRISYEVA